MTDFPLIFQITRNVCDGAKTRKDKTHQAQEPDFNVGIELR